MIPDKTPDMTPLSNPEIRKLKARAQLLEPMLKVGKAGLSDGFIKSVSEALGIHKLVKVKFVEFKEEKKTLSVELAEKTSSHIIMRVGNVVVLYRDVPPVSPDAPAVAS
jgi:RNA-binding protein